MPKNSVTKTNAARLLDQAKIAYELVAYPVDESNLAASHIAETLGEDINVVYKTLVLHGDKTGLFCCIIAGNCEVDLKKAARASGNKKAEMIPMKELLPNTGYIRGGCTALGMKKKMPVYIAQQASSHPFIYVSAGQRGLQIKVAPADWIRITEATEADLTADRPDDGSGL